MLPPISGWVLRPGSYRAQSTSPRDEVRPPLGDGLSAVPSHSHLKTAGSRRSLCCHLTTDRASSPTQLVARGERRCSFTVWCLAGPCWRAQRCRTRHASCSFASARLGIRCPSLCLAQDRITPILASAALSPKGTGNERDRPPQPDRRRAFACEGATSCLGGKASTLEG